MNCGEGTAAKCLQRALGVKDDGIAGKQTIAKALAMIAAGNAANLLLKICAQRDLYYMNLAHTRQSMREYLDGWLNRSKAMKNWAATRLDNGGAA